MNILLKGYGDDMNQLVEGWNNKGSIYHQDALQAKNDFFNDTYIVDGVVRWKSFGHIPPQITLEFWNFLGLNFDYHKSLQYRVEEEKTKYKYNNIQSLSINEGLTSEIYYVDVFKELIEPEVFKNKHNTLMAPKFWKFEME